MKWLLLVFVWRAHQRQMKTPKYQTNNWCCFQTESTSTSEAQTNIQNLSVCSNFNLSLLDEVIKKVIKTSLQKVRYAHHNDKFMYVIILNFHTYIPNFTNLRINETFGFIHCIVQFKHWLVTATSFLIASNTKQVKNYLWKLYMIKLKWWEIQYKWGNG